jgi:hypothetical protein
MGPNPGGLGMREGTGVDINSNAGVLALRAAFLMDLFKDGGG